jgi:Flp pilus assembly protein TadG
MKKTGPTSRQRGIVAVEFALVASLLFMLLFGIMEMSRLLFYLNTAAEATRLGARIASVCALDADAIKTRMTSLFPVIARADIKIDYRPSGCTANSCEQLTVRIAKTQPLQLAIPFVSLPALTWPSFATTLRREGMRNSMTSTANPACVD